MFSTEAKRIFITGAISGIAGAIVFGIADVSAASHSLNIIQSAKILFGPMGHYSPYNAPSDLSVSAVEGSAFGFFLCTTLGVIAGSLHHELRHRRKRF